MRGAEVPDLRTLDGRAANLGSGHYGHRTFCRAGLAPPLCRQSVRLDGRNAERSEDTRKDEHQDEEACPGSEVEGHRAID